MLPDLALGKRHLPQPAHRLDMDTAGCLVLGRTKPLAERQPFRATAGTKNLLGGGPAGGKWTLARSTRRSRSIRPSRQAGG
jgi:hypothetical protein